MEAESTETLKFLTHCKSPRNRGGEKKRKKKKGKKKGGKTKYELNHTFNYIGKHHCPSQTRYRLECHSNKAHRKNIYLTISSC